MLLSPIYPYSPAQTPFSLHSAPRIGSKITAIKTLSTRTPTAVSIGVNQPWVRLGNPGTVGIRPWECSQRVAGYLGIVDHRVAVSGVEELCAPLAMAHPASRSSNLRLRCSGLPPMFSLRRRTCWPKCALNSKAPNDARSQPPRCGGLNDLRPFLVSLSPLRPLFLSAQSEAKA